MRLKHVREYGLDAVEDAVKVHIDYPLPVLESDVLKVLEPVEAGALTPPARENALPLFSGGQVVARSNPVDASRK